MMSTAGGRIGSSPPPILITTASTGAGLPELADAIEKHRTAARSTEQARQRARNQVARALADLAQRRAATSPQWDRTLDAVAARDLDPMTAAERLLDS
jgi:LAO/AO transport system kinase